MHLIRIDMEAPFRSLFSNSRIKNVNSITRAINMFAVDICEGEPILPEVQFIRCICICI